MTSLKASEQYMLELVNEERAQRGLAPLAVDEHLVTAARKHAAFLDDVDYTERAFRNDQGQPDPHIGEGGSDVQDRLEAAGWSPSGSWRIAENVSFATTGSGKADQDVVDRQHTGLMNSQGHRENILNSEFKTIGIGHDLGDYKGSSTAVFNTQNFATDSKNYFTGVAFDDADNDDRYDIGEGLGSVQVTIKDGQGNTVATDQTGDGGGYSIALANGDYTAEFTGDGIDGVIKKEFEISGENEKVDLNADDETGTTPPAQPDDTDGGDTPDTPPVTTKEPDTFPDDDGKDVEEPTTVSKPETPDTPATPDTPDTTGTPADDDDKTAEPDVDVADPCGRGTDSPWDPSDWKQVLDSNWKWGDHRVMSNFLADRTNPDQYKFVWDRDGADKDTGNGAPNGTDDSTQDDFDWFGNLSGNDDSSLEDLGSTWNLDNLSSFFDDWQPGNHHHDFWA